MEEGERGKEMGREKEREECKLCFASFVRWKELLTKLFWKKEKEMIFENIMFEYKMLAYLMWS
jgi:hypothetical protein